MTSLIHADADVNPSMPPRAAKAAWTRSRSSSLAK